MPSIIVDSDGQGSRLDRFLRRKDAYFPQSLFEKWSRQKKLFINGEHAKASSRLNAGDTITFPDEAIPLPPPEEVTKLYLSETEAKKILRPMILFEDDALVILNKPSGLATQGGTGQRTCVDDLFKSAYPGQKFRLTHRIDLETSGILVVAKTLKCASDMTNAFRERTVQKTYMALCEGIFENKEGIINAPIGNSKEELESMSTKGYALKEAITNYRVVAERENLSLLELSPKTGRTHQLRVHMSMLGHPILGDRKYGGSPAKRLMLHAWKISFDGKYFEAPLPKEFSL